MILLRSIKKTILCSIIVLISASAFGQNYLGKFSDKTGLIYDRTNKVNYSITDSRASFTFSAGLDTSKTRKGQMIPKLTTLQVDAGAAIAKNSLDLFSKGEFNPAFDGSIYFARELPLGQKSNAQVTPFIRLGYESKQNKYVFPIADGKDTFILDDAWKQTYGGFLGTNLAVTRYLVFSLSGAYLMSNNSEDALKLRSVETSAISGTDTSGNMLSISSEEDRYIGRPTDNVEIGKIRFDVFCLPFRFSKNRGIPGIGFLLFTESKYREGNLPRYSMAAGPTLHMPLEKKIVKFKKGDDDVKLNMVEGDHEILMALLFRLSDIQTGASNEAIWNDGFSVAVNVGLPIAMFKLKG